MEQMESPTVAELKPQVNNIVLNIREMEAMMALPIADKTEKMVIKKISSLAAKSLDDMLQCAYKSERTGVLSVIYDITLLNRCYWI